MHACINCNKTKQKKTQKKTGNLFEFLVTIWVFQVSSGNPPVLRALLRPLHSGHCEELSSHQEHSGFFSLLFFLFFPQLYLILYFHAARGSGKIPLLGRLWACWGRGGKKNRQKKKKNLGTLRALKLLPLKLVPASARARANWFSYNSGKLKAFFCTRASIKPELARAFWFSPCATRVAVSTEGDKGEMRMKKRRIVRRRAFLNTGEATRARKASRQAGNRRAPGLLPCARGCSPVSHALSHALWQDRYFRNASNRVASSWFIFFDNTEPF